MTSIEQIIDELTDATKTLSGPVLKTKVMASRIGNDDLFQWATAELTGYRDLDKMSIPSYRRGKPSYSCSFTNGYDTMCDQPFPILWVEEDYRNDLLDHKFDQGVQALEELASGGPDGALITKFGMDICGALNNKLSPNVKGSVDIFELTRKIGIHEITQVLAQIRSILLDFMLAVERELPSLDEVVRKRVTLSQDGKEKFERIVHQVIIRAGEGSTITTGNGNIIQ
jgi:hypothetical protein